MSPSPPVTSTAPTTLVSNLGSTPPHEPSAISSNTEPETTELSTVASDIQSSAAAAAASGSGQQRDLALGKELPAETDTRAGQHGVHTKEGTGHGEAEPVVRPPKEVKGEGSVRVQSSSVVGQGTGSGRLRPERPVRRSIDLSAEDQGPVAGPRKRDRDSEFGPTTPRGDEKDGLKGSVNKHIAKKNRIVSRSSPGLTDDAAGAPESPEAADDVEIATPPPATVAGGKSDDETDNISPERTDTDGKKKKETRKVRMIREKVEEMDVEGNRIVVDQEKKASGSEKSTPERPVAAGTKRSTASPEPIAIATSRSLDNQPQSAEEDARRAKAARTRRHGSTSPGSRPASPSDDAEAHKRRRASPKRRAVEVDETATTTVGEEEDRDGDVKLKSMSGDGDKGVKVGEERHVKARRLEHGKEKATGTGSRPGSALETLGTVEGQGEETERDRDREAKRKSWSTTAAAAQTGSAAPATTTTTAGAETKGTKPVAGNSSVGAAKSSQPTFAAFSSVSSPFAAVATSSSSTLGSGGALKTSSSPFGVPSTAPSSSSKPASTFSSSIFGAGGSIEGIGSGSSSTFGGASPFGGGGTATWGSSVSAAPAFGSSSTNRLGGLGKSAFGGSSSTSFGQPASNPQNESGVLPFLAPALEKEKNKDTAGGTGGKVPSSGTGVSPLAARRAASPKSAGGSKAARTTTAAAGGGFSAYAGASPFALAAGSGKSEEKKGTDSEERRLEEEVKQTFSEQDTITGEEDDKILSSTLCRLFAMEDGWKERGRGKLKLNEDMRAALENPDQGRKFRLVMRTEATYRLILNVYIHPKMSAPFKIDTEKLVRFSGFEAGDLKEKQFTAKFPSVAAANDFRKLGLKALEEVKANAAGLEGKDAGKDSVGETSEV